MNRIKLSPLALDDLPESRQASQTTTASPIERSTRTANDECSIFVPLHYEKNYAYPLIVWLHSDGESSEQLQKVMLEMGMRNFVGIAPTAPLGNFETGHFWDQDFETIELAHQTVMNAVDEATMRFNVAPHRIFLAGADSGGTMAFRLAFERPEVFAGVLSINGPIPDQAAPLRDWSRCRELPVFWAHARRSTEFDQDQLCEQLRLLHIAGFSVTLKQYPQCDLLCPGTMSDMNRWVMETIDSAVLDRHPK